MRIISVVVAAVVAVALAATPASASRRDICVSLSVLGLGPIVLSIGDPPDFSCLVQADPTDSDDEEEDTPAKS